jgi:hypothetical protein
MGQNKLPLEPRHLEWKGVKPHILDHGFEILIDPRMEASMSNVVPEG